MSSHSIHGIYGSNVSLPKAIFCATPIVGTVATFIALKTLEYPVPDQRPLVTLRRNITDMQNIHKVVSELLTPETLELNGLKNQYNQLREEHIGQHFESRKVNRASIVFSTAGAISGLLTVALVVYAAAIGIIGPLGLLIALAIPVGCTCTFATNAVVKIQELPRTERILSQLMDTFPEL